ncbi:hypothetical protein H4R21_000844 [Coemansia helicoidea]|uniref:Uncharacterized protein n=2 Tax=Coemansia TaxID=4863 RepID=A0ACC1LFD1_9FUNG|nr:hypothetical protein H4R21_000844 [Coemansia helicoidea]
MHVHGWLAAGTIGARLALSLYIPGPGLPESSQAAAAAVIRTPLATSAPNDFDQRRMLALVNSVRESHGLPPVVYHDKLMQLAQDHAVYQSTNHVVTHVDTSGPIGDRVSQLGLRWTVIAENVGGGAATEDAIMAAWAASPPHMANILQPNVNYMGIGVSHGYWVQDFAAL